MAMGKFTPYPFMKIRRPYFYSVCCECLEDMNPKRTYPSCMKCYKNFKEGVLYDKCIKCKTKFRDPNTFHTCFKCYCEMVEHNYDLEEE